jgi:hypothetical protein
MAEQFTLDQGGLDPAIPEITPVVDNTDAVTVEGAATLLDQGLDVRDEFLKASFKSSLTVEPRPIASYDAERGELARLRAQYLGDENLSQGDRSALVDTISRLDKQLLAKAQGTLREGVVATAHKDLEVRQWKSRYPHLTGYINQIHGAASGRGGSTAMSEIEKLTDPSYQLIKEEQSSRTQFQTWSGGLSAAAHPGAYQKWKFAALEKQNQEANAALMDLATLSINRNALIDERFRVALDPIIPTIIAHQSGTSTGPSLDIINGVLASLELERGDINTLLLMKAQEEGISPSSQKFKDLQEGGMAHFDSRLAMTKEFIQAKPEFDKKTAAQFKAYAAIVDLRTAGQYAAGTASGNIMDAAEWVAGGVAQFDLKLAQMREGGPEQKLQAEELAKIDRNELRQAYAMAARNGLLLAKTDFLAIRNQGWAKMMLGLTPVQKFFATDEMVNSVRSQPGATEEDQTNVVGFAIGTQIREAREMPGQTGVEVAQNIADTVDRYTGINSSAGPELADPKFQGAIRQDLDPLITGAIQSATAELKGGSGILVRLAGNEYAVVDGETGIVISREANDELNVWAGLVAKNPFIGATLGYEDFLTDQVVSAGYKVVDASAFQMGDVTNQFRGDDPLGLDTDPTFADHIRPHLRDKQGRTPPSGPVEALGRLDTAVGDANRSLGRLIYDNTLGLITVETEDGEIHDLESIVSGVGRQFEENIRQDAPPPGQPANLGAESLTEAVVGGGERVLTKRDKNKIGLTDVALKEMEAIDATVVDLFTRIATAETGGEADKFIRTKARGAPGGSSAYGPAQLTMGLALQFKEGFSKLFNDEEKAYLDDFIEQGKKFLTYGNVPDLPANKKKYDYGGKGDLTSKRQKEVYVGVVTKMLQHFFEKFGGDQEKVADAWRFGENSGLTVAKDDPRYHRVLFGG